MLLFIFYSGFFLFHTNPAMTEAATAAAAVAHHMYTVAVHPSPAPDLP